MKARDEDAADHLLSRKNKVMDSPGRDSCNADDLDFRESNALMDSLAEEVDSKMREQEEKGKMKILVSVLISLCMI